MQKCSLCGGRVVNGRCEECGMPIPPEHTYTLRGESAHYHHVNGEDVLHRVRPTGNRPKVDGYDDEERTAHLHESGTDRHDAPRPAVRTAGHREFHIEAPAKRKRSTNVALLIIVLALMIILPTLINLLQRLAFFNTPDSIAATSAEEQAVEADRNAYDDLRGTVPAEGTDWDGDLPAGLYVVGQDLPEGTYTIKCAEDNITADLHIVSDEHGVEIYEDLSSYAYDDAQNGLDDVPLPAGTVLFLTGSGSLYFHSSNAQVDALPTATAPNPVTGDVSFTLSGGDDGSLYLTVGEDIEPGVYDVACTAGSGYFAFDLPMENTRTMYCSAWLYGDPDYADTLQHVTLVENTEVLLSNYSDPDFTVTLTPTEAVYIHE